MLAQLTAEQFLERRIELPDAGQWAELAEGVPVFLQPPDLDYGNTVLNLSKALADYVQESQRGYACFDLGLLLARHPDTVRFPAVCYFLEGGRFAEADKQVTTTVPVLVVEVASTADRRLQAAERTRQYLEWGVRLVWVIDSQAHCVDVARPAGDVQRLFAGETLTGEPCLEGFRLPVAELFLEPHWWNPPR
jgi:Uma2 family endonuclease